MSGQQISIGSRMVEVANLDKVIFPDDDITQGELIEYYRRIGETILPYVRSRPLTMQRFPDGIGAEGFYQKEAPDYFPDWIRRVSVEVKGQDRCQEQVVCDDLATLAYLVDQGLITPHIWLSRADDLEHPDRLVFDLDPPDDDFGPIRSAARSLRDVLTGIGLVPYLMTTGSRGLHVVVPLDRTSDFDAVREFARRVADLLADRQPDALTTEMRKQKRGDRLFLDYLRNSYGQNTVAPYAVRAIRGAPIAAPIDWEELSDHSLRAQTYTMKNIFRRLGQKKDPWKCMMRRARSLRTPAEKLGRLESDR